MSPSLATSTEVFEMLLDPDEFCDKRKFDFWSSELVFCISTTAEEPHSSFSNASSVFVGVHCISAKICMKHSHGKYRVSKS